MKTIISIDPGHHGAIAVKCGDDVIVHKLCESMTQNLDTIRSICSECPLARAIVEKVGASMPGNSSKASTTFARHCGHIEAALYLLCVSVAWNPTPAQWMKRISVPAGLEKPERKRWIKDWAARRYPAIDVTLWNADALAMLAAFEDIA